MSTRSEKNWEESAGSATQRRSDEERVSERRVEGMRDTDR